MSRRTIITIALTLLALLLLGYLAHSLNIVGALRALHGG